MRRLALLAVLMALGLFVAPKEASAHWWYRGAYYSYPTYYVAPVYAGPAYYSSYYYAPAPSSRPIIRGTIRRIRSIRLTRHTTRPTIPRTTRFTTAGTTRVTWAGNDAPATLAAVSNRKK